MEIILRKPSKENKDVSDITRVEINKNDLLLIYSSQSITVYDELAQPHLGVFGKLGEDFMWLRERAFLLQLPLTIGESGIAYPKRANQIQRYNLKKLNSIYVGPEDIANHLSTKTNGLEKYADWVRAMKSPYQLE